MEIRRRAANLFIRLPPRYIDIKPVFWQIFSTNNPIAASHLLVAHERAEQSRLQKSRVCLIKKVSPLVAFWQAAGN
jgi:hypothetical protein